MCNAQKLIFVLYELIVGRHSSIIKLTTVYEGTIRRKENAVRRDDAVRVICEEDAMRGDDSVRGDDVAQEDDDLCVIIFHSILTSMFTNCSCIPEHLIIALGS